MGPLTEFNIFSKVKLDQLPKNKCDEYGKINLEEFKSKSSLNSRKRLKLEKS